MDKTGKNSAICTPIAEKIKSAFRCLGILPVHGATAWQCSSGHPGITDGRVLGYYAEPKGSETFRFLSYATNLDSPPRVLLADFQPRIVQRGSRLWLRHSCLCADDQSSPSVADARFYRRTGSLWEGRYKSSVVQAESYLLACRRYIELKPVRAGMVVDPGQYPWSSYRANGLGHQDVRLTQLERYRSLQDFGF